MLGLPASLNRFSYVHNNPLRYTDPSGHVAQIAIGAAAGAAFVFLVDFGYQTVDVYFTGQRDQYDLAELGAATLGGAAFGAVIASGGLAAGALGVGAAYWAGVTIGGTAVGLTSAYLNYTDQRYGYAAVDMLAAVGPFAFKGVRSGTGEMFRDFWGGGYNSRALPAVWTEGNFSSQTGLGRLASRVKGMLPEREGPGLLTSRELPEILLQRRQGRSGGGGNSGLGGEELALPGGGQVRSSALEETPVSARDQFIESVNGAGNGGGSPNQKPTHLIKRSGEVKDLQPGLTAEQKALARANKGFTLEWLEYLTDIEN